MKSQQTSTSKSRDDNTGRREKEIIDEDDGKREREMMAVSFKILSETNRTAKETASLS
jgi:hypothetical protein